MMHEVMKFIQHSTLQGDTDRRGCRVNWILLDICM